jgi:hypothetical protein
LTLLPGRPIFGIITIKEQIRMKNVCVAAVAVVLGFSGIVTAQEVVQIDVKSILNTRSVTTLTDNKLVIWIKGIDTGGDGNGYLTMAAALSIGNQNPKALPDDPTFPADNNHPAFKLNYSDNQTRYVIGVGEFTVTVPERKYSKMYLFLTSAEGPSPLTCTLNYTDGIETHKYVLPDYYDDLPANDVNFCYVAYDLAKWGKNNNMNEANHHNIDALNVHPNSDKVLKSVKVQKTQSEGYLVFWGATGVANGPTAVSYSAKSSDLRDQFASMRVLSSRTNSPAIQFFNLPPNATADIYRVDGAKVAALAATGSGHLIWQTNDRIPSGTYLCNIRTGEAHKIVTVVVSR